MKRPCIKLFIISILPLSILTFFLSACTIDAYDKGEGDLSLMRADLVLGFTDSKRQVQEVETDEGDRLTLTKPLRMSWMERPDSAYRMALYYNKVENHQAEVVAFGPVGVVVPHRFRETKSDPVRFESLWVGTNRRFLNTSLYLMTGATSDDSIRHVVGAAIDTLMQNDDGTSTLHLTFYHDQAGVPEYYSQRTFLSIPLDSVQADSLHLRINTYEGMVSKTVSLHTATQQP